MQLCDTKIVLVDEQVHFEATARCNLECNLKAMAAVLVDCNDHFD